MTTARIELPPKLIPVFSGQADVRGAFGGRGSAKTRTFAKMTAVRGYIWSKAGREGIILCGRQFMNSLDDSSLEEIKAAIRSEPWLAAHYEIGEKYVRTKDKRVSYKFIGLDRNVDSVKSKSRILLAWVDEAEPVTEDAWQKLIPTLREEDSELWVTWNPERRKSPTDNRFRQVTDPRIKVVEMNWRDNPWFPKILDRVRLKDQRERPDTYDHIWEGDYGTQQGAILAHLVTQAEKAGRINDAVEYDPEGAAVEISSDIGFRDTATWWYWQRKIGGYSVLDFDGDSGLDAEEWIDRIKVRLAKRGYRLGKIWLPHDARTKTFQSKHSAIEQFISAFGPAKCGIVPQTSKLDRINAARTIIRRCEFHKTRTEPGVDGLRAWEYTWNPDTLSFSREPLHNWASHPSDGYSYGCQIMEGLAPAAEPPPDAKNMHDLTLDELWKKQKPRSKRI